MNKSIFGPLALCMLLPICQSKSAIAQTTDSTTWEGSYEADQLPSDNGWTNSGAGNFTSLGTGPDVGTISLNNLTQNTGFPLGLWEIDPSFNFTTGSSFEIRAKVNDPTSGANAMIINLHDGTDDLVRLRLFGSPQAQIAYGTSYGFQAFSVDTSQYNTYRITMLDGTDNVRVYLNDNPFPVGTGTLEQAGIAPQRGLFFGDVTGAPGQQSDWSIDYIRWTNQGAFELLPGDFNGDASVDAQDLAIWETGFGTTSGASLGDGDADIDDDVDGMDFLIWQRNYSPPPSSIVAATVPEPTSCLLWVLGGLSLLASAKSRRLESR